MFEYQKRPAYKTKETYLAAKETYLVAKETYLVAKETYCYLKGLLGRGAFPSVRAWCLI